MGAESIDFSGISVRANRTMLLKSGENFNRLKVETLMMHLLNRNVLRYAAALIALA
jgi:hypothetical protein